MDHHEMQGFFADESALDREAYVVFTYAFETTGDPAVVAAHLCRETSTAQWRRPGADEDFRPLHGAKVLDVQETGESDTSAFGARGDGRRWRQARVRIAHPHRNFGARIPGLLTVAMGEGAFFCGGIEAIRLLDIEFPDTYVSAFEGPRFGTAGLRRILGIADRPLFFGVVKPNVGLPPSSFAGIALEAWLGGLDAAKDDEMLADASYSPFTERMRLVGEAMRRAEDATGEKKMFIANVTDEVDRLAELHDVAVASGINAVMVNAMAVGLSGVRLLRRHAQVPIVAHFDGIAPMSRHPRFGVSSAVITKLQRLAGCDAIIMPGFGARMMTPEEEVLANCAECTKPLGAHLPALPVPGGSDWAGTLPAMFERLRTVDFAMVPGRGVFNHPMGPRAGAMSFRQAWEAVAGRIDLGAHAETRPELAAAIEAFGSDSVSPDEEQRLPEAVGFTGAELFFGKQ